ncbi:MAG TPA: plastocyanin/azurin family copper-binding protein [Solirubrobacteraceae bacterium]|jgi:plastocyanin|nr:plastocyanin/azurin family copper-binding protein [Solirubrobacteraceae bacterium]
MRRRGRILIGSAVAILAVAVMAVAALAATDQVRIADNYFSVKRLTIARGTRVAWRWVGELNHNVTVKSGPSRFHSRTQAVGSFSHVFDRKGTYTLYCTIHPYMKMTIVVR